MGILDKFSLKDLFEASPELYGYANSVEKDIKRAIDEEVAKYNFTGDKADYVRAKVEGSIIGSLHYDQSFIKALNMATTSSSRQEIIRGYIRNYISREIDIEIANVQKEIRQNVQNKAGNLFSVFDPRWKKKVKDGDYSQYEEYRKNIQNYLMPTIGGGGEGDSSVINTTAPSDYYSYLNDAVKEYNKGKLTIPAGVSPQAYFDKLAQDAYNASEVKNFVHGDTGRLLNSQELSTLSNIHSNSGKEGGIRSNLSGEKKIELLDDLGRGDVDSASKKYVKRFEFFGKVSSAAPKEVLGELLISGKTSGRTYQEFSKDLISEIPRIVIDSSGKAILKGKDIFQQIHSQALKDYTEGLKKNPKKAIQEFQHQNIAANISSLQFLIHKGTGPIRELQAALEKNELVHDILNFAKATKSFTSFSTKNTAEATRLKNRILASVSSGAIRFKSDGEKNRFIEAVNTNDSRFLNNFITPGMFGGGTFGNLVKEVNDINFDLGGRVGSSELITRSLNFENNIGLYKRSVLNNVIFAAQLGYDSGYFVSEIKKRLKESQVGQIWTKLDTKVSWESIKKKTQDSFISFATSSAIFGKFAANRGELESLFKMYNGEMSWGEFLKIAAKARFEKFLGKKIEDLVNLGFKWTLKDIMSSRFYQLSKLKLLKNLRYLERFALLGFKKLAGPLGGAFSKLIAKGWGRFAGGIGRVFATFGGYLSSLLGGLGPSGAAIARFVRVLSISLIVLLLYFILILLPPIQVILGGFNGLSSSRYDPESLADQNYGAARPLSGQGNVISSGVFTSGNACVASDGRAMNTSEYSDWNNLSLSDFENTKNDVNCRIMCNAKNTMGAMFIGTGNSINCNALKSIGSPTSFNQFVCTDLVVASYKDDDPYLTARLVIDQDRYLESKPGIYEEIELAVPNNPSNPETLSVYNPRCVPLDKFAPGNIFVMRANTCNDTYDAGRYQTINPSTGTVVSTWGAHVELVLKVVDEGGKKVLYNLSTNHIRKKIKYNLTKCDGNNYKLSSEDQKTFIGETMVKSFPCKMYELKNVNTSLSCPKDELGNDACIIGPNNYPDFGNYESVPLNRSGVRAPSTLLQ